MALNFGLAEYYNVCSGMRWRDCVDFPSLCTSVKMHKGPLLALVYTVLPSKLLQCIAEYWQQRRGAIISPLCEDR